MSQEVLENLSGAMVDIDQDLFHLVARQGFGDCRLGEVFVHPLVNRFYKLLLLEVYGLHLVPADVEISRRFPRVIAYAHQV